MGHKFEELSRKEVVGMAALCKAMLLFKQVWIFEIPLGLAHLINFLLLEIYLNATDTHTAPEEDTGLIWVPNGNSFGI